MIKAFGFGIVLVAAFCAPGATADPITYYYTGQDFTQANSPYTTSDSISGHVTMNDPLGDNLTLSSVAPTDFSFSDGILTFDTANVPLQDASFAFTTDGTGMITNWEIFMEYGPGEGFMFTNDPGNISSAEDYASNTRERGENTSLPGTWTAVEAAPEPSPACFTSIGLLALVIRARKRTFPGAGQIGRAHV